MLAFASSRGSWVVSLAVLGLACTGIREDPTPSDNAPPELCEPGSLGGAGVTSGGGAPLGGGLPFLFEDCACASIIETGPPTLCADCVQLATTAPAPCAAMQNECDRNTSCQTARVLLDAPQCADDPPSCVGELLNDSLDEDSALLLFNYYACLCNSCGDCTPQQGGGGAGGGGVGGAASGGASAGGGAPISADSCIVEQ